MSAVGFGCNQIGSAKTGYKDFGSAKRAVYNALDHGINYFDTAGNYGSGNSETWLGNILDTERKRVFISTKAGMIPGGGRNGHPAYLKKTLQTSLKKLKTDYVDIFYLHRPDPNIPLDESLGGISDLVKEGKARFGGVSTVEPNDLMSISNGKVVSCVQYCLNFFEFELANAVKSHIKQKGYGFSSYSAFDSGWMLKKKYLDLSNVKIKLFRFGFYRPEFPTFSTLCHITKANGITLHELALLWILSRDYVHSVILGSSTWEQLYESIFVLDKRLPKDLLEKVNEIVMQGHSRKKRFRKKIWQTLLKVKKMQF